MKFSCLSLDGGKRESFFIEFRLGVFRHNDDGLCRGSRLISFREISRSAPNAFCEFFKLGSAIMFMSI